MVGLNIWIRLPHHARTPIRPRSAKKDEKCPGPDEYANFSKNIFASEIGSESPRIKTFVRDVKATWVRGLNVSSWWN